MTATPRWADEPPASVMQAWEATAVLCDGCRVNHHREAL